MNNASAPLADRSCQRGSNRASTTCSLRVSGMAIRIATSAWCCVWSWTLGSHIDQVCAALPVEASASPTQPIPQEAGDRIGRTNDCYRGLTQLMEPREKSGLDDRPPVKANQVKVDRQLVALGSLMRPKKSSESRNGPPAARPATADLKAESLKRIAEMDAKPIRHNLTRIPDGADAAVSRVRRQKSGGKRERGGHVIEIVQFTEEIPTPSAELTENERPISEIEVKEGEETNVPLNEAREWLDAQGRLPDDILKRDRWAGCLYEWEASLLCHRPLYFEEINAERYGYTCHPICQPLVSGAHFFATVPILPYKMALDAPRRPIYTLGYYRPGSVAPYQFHRLPLRPKAALSAVGIATGLIFAIP